MLPRANISGKDVAWHAFVILTAVGVYAYMSNAPLRKLAATCASIAPGTEARDLQNWAIDQGADPAYTRWTSTAESPVLTISFRTGRNNYQRACDVKTQAGKVIAVTQP